MKSQIPNLAQVTANHIELIKTLNKLNEQSVYIYNLASKRFEYITEHISLLCGHDREFVKVWGIDFFVRHSPKNKMNALQTVYKACSDFLNLLSKEEIIDSCVLHNFYFENRNKLLLLNHKIAPLLLDDSGNIVLVVGVLSHATTYSVGKIQIKNERTKKTYEYDIDKTEWIVKDRPLITDREKEIVLLSVQGLTNRNIAKQIHLSEAAIKFHKSKLFRKLEVSNIAEAVGCILNLGKL